MLFSDFFFFSFCVNFLSFFAWGFDCVGFRLVK